jgi:hypothetical protein
LPSLPNGGPGLDPAPPTDLPRKTRPDEIRTSGHLMKSWTCQRRIPPRLVAACSSLLLQFGGVLKPIHVDTPTDVDMT